ncbi:hypothetical protein KPH14_012111 [Odynerus spinipes]|uniref:Nucleolus and neural progenitor protein-like N-terminal domain-containing protein n=1 Tax=Odynerus spinipes TaxID=1348599 RepID=A0AAD9R9K7_9HYME|nr:hypothetical protein KPH14_012111 [Odynerus spinipes]
MEPIWNRIHVEHPPNTTWRIETRKFDVTGLRATLERIIKDLESQNIIHVEATILSRLIYRMKCKFRNDKGFKNLEKVNRALLNYLSLALEKEYKNFQSYIELDNKFVTLPSKQMLEYVLVRTQGFAKLLARVEEVAKCAGTFLRTRIVLGHAWTVTLVAYAVISRIWILSRHLVRRSCIWYNGLYRFLNTFKAVGFLWLSTNNNLPSDLKSWLALPWFDEDESSIPDETILKNKMFKLLQVQDDDLYEDLIVDSKDESMELGITDFTFNTSEQNISKETISRNIDKPIIHVDDDLGEFISRSDCTFNPGKRRQEEKEPAKKQKLSVTNINHENNTEQIVILESENQNEKQVESSTIINQLESKTKKNKHKKKKKLVQSCNTTSNKNFSSNFNNMTESDLNELLHKDNYPGMDKLQWNIIKNKCNKLLKQSNKCSGKKKKILIKKTITFIQKSI